MHNINVGLHEKLNIDRRKRRNANAINQFKYAPPLPRKKINEADPLINLTLINYVNKKNLNCICLCKVLTV